MPVPPPVERLLRQGLELGEAMDVVTGEHDIKRGRGAVGVLTAGLVTRERAYETIVAYALAPFLAAELWLDPADRRGAQDDDGRAHAVGDAT
jgi:non-canonical (house-cleaning) NTP pyrophosphatase